MHRSKVIIVTIVLLVVASFGIGLFISSRAEPRYNGKGICEWALALEFGNGQQIAEARPAIKALGPSTVPYLVRVLESRDARLEVWLRIHVFRSGDSAEMSHRVAAIALR